MPSTAVSLLALPDQFGPYRIVRRLGKGGMGTVFLACDTRLDREVALKICHLSEQPHALERFRREAKAAANLSHPNLCPVYEYDVRDGIAYLTMAFIDGPTLREILVKHRQMVPRDAAQLVARLALAMQAAHDAGIIHRDLKPANVIINKKGEPVILDFGLARQTDATGLGMTRPGMMVGTPTYMAPEQMDDNLGPISPASDVYSLGVILYELLTGRVPFKGPMASIIFNVVQQPPLPPSQRNPAVDARLEAVCLKALAKKPAERYPNMAAFAVALTEAAHHSSPDLAPAADEPAAPSVSEPQWWPPPPPASAAGSATPKRFPAGTKRAKHWTVVAVIVALTLLPMGIALWQFNQRPAAAVNPPMPDQLPPNHAGDLPPQTAGTPIANRLERPRAVLPPLVPSAFMARFSQSPAPRPRLWLPNEAFVNTADMRLVYLGPGTFLMGSTQAEREQTRPSKDEMQHRVTLSRGFHMSTTLVTQQQWKAVMGEKNNPSAFQGDDLPVENVSWIDCKTFCDRLSLKEGRPYRLPREAEWEYACRAGTTTPFWTGETIRTTQANFNGTFSYPASKEMGEARERTTPVMAFPANPWGLHDMHGNLQQWCEDWYDDYPNKDVVVDPKGPADGQTRVLRGGSWRVYPWDCRAASRDDGEPLVRHRSIGFRVVVPGYALKP